MNTQDYANIGSAVLTGSPTFVRPLGEHALHARRHSEDLRRLIAYASPTTENLNNTVDGPNIGWTTPALTYDKMRQVNGSALSLNFDIEANVKRQAFKNSWNQWFTSWQTFFNRYQSMTGKFGAIFDSDAVAAQTESFRVQLMGNPSAPAKPDGKPSQPGWILAYEAEGTAEQPVPPSSAARVTPQSTPENPAGKEKEKEKDEGLPWWGTALFIAGGVGILAGSFFIIRRKVIESKQAEHFIKRDVLPIVLGGVAGPTGIAFAHAATNRFATTPTAHDPSWGIPSGVGHDLSGMGGPAYYGAGYVGG